MSEWISVEDRIPENDDPVVVKSLMRFKRYKPSSNEFRKGLIGRWQEWNGYGWKNCEDPCEWMPLPELMEKD